MIESPEACHEAGGVDLQFFITPDHLADRLWDMMEVKQVDRLLDACAGTGALADAYVRSLDRRSWMSRGDPMKVDAIEIDPRHHAALRGKGYRLSGMDFLSFEGLACYTTVLINPPFHNGAKFVLRAWDGLWSGQVGAILNAETIRNPRTSERRRLLELIERFGKVEIVKDAFATSDTKACVDVALIYLKKPAQEAQGWIQDMIDGLKAEDVPEHGYAAPGELALPVGFVEGQCRAFNAAVTAMRAAVKASAVATHYARRIGKTMVERKAGVTANADLPDEDLGEIVRKEMAAQYHGLKDRAWASVLAHTEAMGKLSSKVKQAAQAQFAEIQALEFTPSNVHGFLMGLVQAQPELQHRMCEEVFDLFARFHVDNCHLHRGWVSNSKHRTLGMRLKYTRFILPGHSRDSGYSTPPYGTLDLLRDIDRVFAMVDGKFEPEVSMASVFTERYRDLFRGARVAASYFELRWYPGVGTLHFFPVRRDLVDRLNRVVGARRSWIPPGDEAEHPTFWRQYKGADKLDKEIREAVAAERKQRAGIRLSRWDDPVGEALKPDGERQQMSVEIVDAAVDHVLAKHGMLEGLQEEISKWRLSHESMQSGPTMLLASSACAVDING
jgi:Domain of unknown function (DUF4942)